MQTRRHVHEEVFAQPVPRVFAALLRPSAVRAWWSAQSVVILPERGGTWAAAWGEDEDDPDYVTIARIAELDTDRRLLLTDYRYRAKSGPMPFETDFSVEFLTEAHAEGTRLRVTQDGFSAGVEGDAFLEGCKKGWTATFAGLRSYLEGSGK